MSQGPTVVYPLHGRLCYGCKYPMPALAIGEVDILIAHPCRVIPILAHQLDNTIGRIEPAQLLSAVYVQRSLGIRPVPYQPVTILGIRAGDNQVPHGLLIR